MNITERMRKLVLSRKPEVGQRGVKRAIANACGISYEAVRQWFSGDTTSIKNENLIAISEKFDTTVDWLLSGDGEPPRKSSIIPIENADSSQSHISHESKQAIARIELAAEKGLLSTEDIELIELIAERIAGKLKEETTPGLGLANKRLKEKLRKNDDSSAVR